jgi:hypothetical protein
MPIKKRDPIITGREFVHPWSPSEPCPCGSGKFFAHCCSRPDGGIYKAFTLPIPPAPVTGYGKAGCYMKWTADCSYRISGEHFVSASVLTLVGETNVTVNGAPWLPQGEAKALPIRRLVGNILCTRHNEAMSPLDTAAGKFFRAIKSIDEDLSDVKTLSCKRRWWLFSGEELELWLLKTAFAVYYSGNASKYRKKLCEICEINNEMTRAFQGRSISYPCGLHVMREEGVVVHGLDFNPVLNDSNDRMVGLRLRFLNLSLLVLLDPLMSYGEALLSNQTYRPHYLYFRHRDRRRRTHTIALTWPRMSEKKAVIFDDIGPIRG